MRTISTIYKFIGIWVSFFAFAAIANAAQPQDTIVNYVVVYPGNEIYELEGHAALRITTPDKDVAINYGMFSFNQPNFIYRFVKGQTDYMVGEIPWSIFEHEYQRSQRRMEAFRLNMNSEQTRRLLELVETNLRPENRTYRYNYVLDNCATRPLRTVELALGDTIILGTPSAPQKAADTWRRAMNMYHKNYPWYQFGIDICLGTDIDRTLDNREMAFAPATLANQLEGAHIGSPEGLPLVISKQIYIDYEPYSTVLPATPWYATPLAVCWMLCILIVSLTVYYTLKRKSYPRLTACVWFTVIGVIGLLVTFLVFVSEHYATDVNFNILWLNPLYFIPAITVWLSGCNKITNYILALLLLMMVAVLVVWIAGVQMPNPAFVPMLLTSATLAAFYIHTHSNVFSKKP